VSAASPARRSRPSSVPGARRSYVRSARVRPVPWRHICVREHTQITKVNNRTSHIGGRQTERLSTSGSAKTAADRKPGSTDSSMTARTVPRSRVAGRRGVPWWMRSCDRDAATSWETDPATRPCLPTEHRDRRVEGVNPLRSDCRKTKSRKQRRELRVIVLRVMRSGRRDPRS
jgi:hypothetical protein